MRTGAVWYGSGMDEKVTTSVRFTPEVVERIDRYAAAHEWSRNKAITRLVAQALGVVTEGAPLDLDVGVRPLPEKMKTSAGFSPSPVEPSASAAEEGGGVAAPPPTKVEVEEAGKLDCKHPKAKRKNLGYAVICGVCGVKL